MLGNFMKNLLFYYKEVSTIDDEMNRTKAMVRNLNEDSVDTITFINEKGLVINNVWGAYLGELYVPEGKSFTEVYEQSEEIQNLVAIGYVIKGASPLTLTDQSNLWGLWCENYEEMLECGNGNLKRVR